MSADAAVVSQGSIVPPGLRPLLLLIGVAAAVAIGVGVVLWTKEPTYSLLYGELGSQDAAQISQALETSGIPYKIEPTTGAITVPADRVHDARLKLAGQGLPEGDGGFALIAKDPGFGVSQFMEGARYQHALETELARTIGNIQQVEAARVHLALPRQSAFVRDRRPASASVFLQLKPGRRLEAEQVTSISNLVASGIPELEASQVTVVDQQGRLLSSPEGNDEFAARDKQFEASRRMEEIYTQRIEALLTPLIGPGRVRAQVVADVEMSVTEEAREQYRPESQIVRSEQSAEESSRGGSGAQGVPGALTNQPPQPGVALPPGASAAGAPTGASATAAQSSPDNSSRQSTRNYEIDRTVAYTRQPAGRLKRLTVAVLVDNMRATAEDGTVTETPLAPEQLENMTKLVRDAVGFDEKRGDSVNVVNASFRPEAALEEVQPETVPLWQQPMVRDIAKLAGGAILLLVLFLSVLRPLVNGLLTQARTQYLPPTPVLATAEGAPALVDAGAPQPSEYEQRITQARTIVTQDPRRVAQVVQGWVGNDE